MSTTQLTDNIKQSIQQAYSAWLKARGFNARRGQREMIAAIARVLCADGEKARLAVIEAGTGTGKTAAYCLSALPIGAALNKRIVISTATIALQEQIVMRDLPDLQERTGLKFEVALAKGRRRYVCPRRLDDLVTDPGGQSELPGFIAHSDEELAQYYLMAESFKSNGWDGELDSWPDSLGEGVWQAVSTDNRGCSNRRCSHFSHCPFFQARTRLDNVDLIVANHDLVLSDLSLGGGAVLTAPEETIYLLDEAHHLADKTRQHFTKKTRIQGSIQWLDQVNANLGTMTQRFGRPAELSALVQSIVKQSPLIAEQLGNVGALLATLDFDVRDAEKYIFRFTLGRVDRQIAELCSEMKLLLTPLNNRLEQVHDLLEQTVDGDLDWQNSEEAEDWLGIIGQLQQRGLVIDELFRDWGKTDEGKDVQSARWVVNIESEMGHDFELVSAPLLPGNLLREVLWDTCYAAVCTSATLTALGKFDAFIDQVGITPDISLRIPSPFDYASIASICVPPMDSDPRDFEAHTAEIATLIPDLVSQEMSGLILFSSWRQMDATMALLGKSVRDLFCVQGTGSKQSLLDEHRMRIDGKQRSYLVGLASFSEGVDLPDDYCRHVVIVRLPFSVPDDPVAQAMAEWIEERGGNSFFDISLPQASMKLIQACGRLIRHENDRGRITLLDKRIVTQRYGRSLLAALPPYRQEFSGY
ncbi:MAG: ATP-dependent DNA helicase DinG [Pseudomonadales bacterium]|nr:ATP-dependent DNA helicase DinG [Pseudomonadales bacterium]